jgi:Rod binding domain-containing protein
MITLAEVRPPAWALHDAPPQRPRAEPETPEHRKLCKAAQDFEGVLLSTWWQQMQKSFPESSDTEREAGSDTFSSLAIQTMSSALAYRGGLGIARMLIRQLEPGLRASQPHGAGERY